jgi:hypothetical protein
MTSFDEREKSFERKFELDQEMAFKLKARRHKLIGLWAAQQLGLKGDAAEAYAHELATLGLDHHGDDDTIARIARDFAAKGIAFDRTRVQLELDHSDREAKKQLGIGG